MTQHAWLVVAVALFLAPDPSGVDDAAEHHSAGVEFHLAREHPRHAWTEFQLALRHQWPTRFTGDFSAFVAFTKELDIRPLLTRQPMTLVSRWNSATLARCLVFYNFRPKLEWPE